MQTNLKIYRVFFFVLAAIAFFLLIRPYTQYVMIKSNEITSNRVFIAKDEPNAIIKNRFDTIYEKNLWSPEGDGSGSGSKLEETRAAHKIIIDVIKEYNIKSMIDAPCGSFLWMSGVVRDINDVFKTKRGKSSFRYHGVDVVESVIKKVKEKYSNFSKNCQFSVRDFSTQGLPENYELVFSRDALMHLSYDKVFFPF